MCNLNGKWDISDVYDPVRGKISADNYVLLSCSDYNNLFVVQISNIICFNNKVDSA